MYTRLQIGLWTAAVFGLATIDTVDAKVQTKGGMNYSHVVAELHQAKHLLDHVNHNYNGHRAKADHEINQAIHILHHEHHKTGAHKGEHKHKAMHESQQKSDTELRMAEKLVHAALHELSGHQDPKAHEASKQLRKAAHEIEQALHAHHKQHAKK